MKRLIALAAVLAASALAQRYTGTGTVTANSFVTNGTGAGSVKLTDSGDSNGLFLKGYTGTRSASLTLAAPGTDPTATNGVPMWGAPSATIATFDSWINPQRMVAHTITLATGSSATQCLASLALPAAALNTVGATYQFYGSGTYSSGTSGTTTWKWQLSTATGCGGSTTDLASVAFGTALAASGYFRIVGLVATQTASASGAVYTSIEANQLITGSAYQNRFQDSNGVTVDTTGTYFLNLVVTTASATPTWNQRIGFVQRVN